MGKRLIYEEVVKIVEDLGGKFLSLDYNKLKDTYLFICSECKKEKFERNFKSYREGQTKCKYCSGAKINLKPILNWLEDNEYQILKINDNGYSSSIKTKCKCGNPVSKTYITLDKIINNNGEIKCKSCISKDLNLKYSYEFVKNYIEKNKDFKVLTNKDKYKNSYSSLDIKCRCGNSYKRTFNRVINEQGILCHDCKDKVRWFKYSKTKIKELDLWLKENKPDYILISRKYHRIDDIFTLKYIGDIHNIPDEYRVFKTRFTDFKYRNQRHPMVNMTKGEERIYKWLYKNNINFEYQYSDESLLGDKRKLKFDFALLDSYNNVELLCEYDGGHHFFPVEYYKGEKTFQKTKEYDAKKNKWAKENNIPLLRIPYFEFDNIEEILSKEVVIWREYLKTT